jgi:hypothetical protein
MTECCVWAGTTVGLGLPTRSAWDDFHNGVGIFADQVKVPQPGNEPEPPTEETEPPLEDDATVQHEAPEE